MWNWVLRIGSHQEMWQGSEDMHVQALLRKECGEKGQRAGMTLGVCSGCERARKSLLWELRVSATKGERYRRNACCQPSALLQPPSEALGPETESPKGAFWNKYLAMGTNAKASLKSPFLSFISICCHRMKNQWFLFHEMFFPEY